MDVTSFFARLVQPGRPPGIVKQPDDLEDFESAWEAVQETLNHPDERQIVRGIASTDVPRHLRHMVDALGYENNRTDENETGVCFEYFLRNDVLSVLEKLSSADRPHGIKGEVLRSINNLVVLLSDNFLIHNAVHRPLRRLLRSCVGDETDDVDSGAARLFGAAGMDRGRANSEEIGDFDGDLVDLMCILCSKMRAYPPLLLIFFHDKTQQSGTPKKDPAHVLRPFSPTPSARTSVSRPSIHQSTSSRALPRFEFLLFSYLLRYVHREGRTGDFARAGLLFLFDIAFLSASQDDTGDAQFSAGKDGSDPLQNARDALGEYILDCDFPEVMAAALGAVYSLLPSKIRVATLAEQAEHSIIGGEGPEGDREGRRHLGDAVARESDEDETWGVYDSLSCTVDPAVHSQIDLLLKLFGFLQDIITRCLPARAETTVTQTHLIGTAIANAALDAIQTSFLENILYPSILESSPADGTAVAVMTYLHILLANLDDGPLLSRVMHFLLDTESDEGPRLAPHHQPKRFTRRPSSVHHESSSEHGADHFGQTGKFTMKDLIADNLGSGHSAARTAALQLLHIMLQEHCATSVNGLIPIKLVSADVEQHAADPIELESYADLVSSLDPRNDAFESTSGFAAYLSDMYACLQADQCFILGQINGADLDDLDKPELARPHRLLPLRHLLDLSDPILQGVLQALGDFLSRAPDENVALCSVLISLSTCARRSLSAWILRDMQEDDVEPWARKSAEDGDGGGDGVLPADRKQPILFHVFSFLIDQIHTIRTTIPTLDALLGDRRRDLLSSESIDEAMTLALTVDVLDTTPVKTPSTAPITPRPKLPPARSSLASSIKGFFSPRKQTPFREQGEGSDSSSRPGTPSRTPRTTQQGSAPANLSSKITVRAVPVSTSIQQMAADEAPNVTGDTAATEISLDRFLDNVVILEEVIKEIVAILTVRRALGIDPVKY